MNTKNSGARPKNLLAGVRKMLPGLLILPTVALILSGIMTWANVGFGDAFLPRWGKSFVTSLLVLPMILMCLGALERLVNRLFGNMHWIGRKLMVAMLTACAIETVLALATTMLNNPWDHSFSGVWWMAFSRSLPAGVVIGLFMTFYMKPKLDRMRLAAEAVA